MGLPSYAFYEVLEFNDGVLTFNRRYEHRLGGKVVLVFTGTLTGDAIVGTIEYRQPSGAVLTQKWEAKRTRLPRLPRMTFAMFRFTIRDVLWQMVVLVLGQHGGQAAVSSAAGSDFKPHVLRWPVKFREPTVTTDGEMIFKKDSWRILVDRSKVVVSTYAGQHGHNQWGA